MSRIRNRIGNTGKRTAFAAGLMGVSAVQYQHTKGEDTLKLAVVSLQYRLCLFEPAGYWTAARSENTTPLPYISSLDDITPLRVNHPAGWNATAIAKGFATSV
jgi:hypothetical protein